MALSRKSLRSEHSEQSNSGIIKKNLWHSHFLVENPVTLGTKQSKYLFIVKVIYLLIE